MTASIDEIRQRVIKLVQELLLDEVGSDGITPAAISRQIDAVLAIRPSWGDDLNRDDVTKELVQRFSLWIGKDSSLKNDAGHIAWLDSARKREWRYWQRYAEWLENKISIRAVDALDRSTDSILGLLEDPLRSDVWDRRGLIVGHVQSGKTSNYTGLICKAADAGYKIIIVLAGMHNNLRSQTQVRLEEGFLGYANHANSEQFEFIGVGANGRDALIKPNCATNRSDNGDFNRSRRPMAISPEERPWLFVVKKNKSVLESLLNWIKNHAANSVDSESGRKIVTHLPLLVVDDEADHASVDTGVQLFDENGVPDEEHEPKAINSLIRRILHSFSRKAYVGYTATPFANIFIHERGETKLEGPDLFPSAFIISLAAPSNYIGPARVFGLSSPQGRIGSLPLSRPIPNEETEIPSDTWLPSTHKNGHVPRYCRRDEIPPSLMKAIDSFILACAVRRIRGQGKEHCSMLIHVTRFTSVQEEVHRQVKEHVANLRQRLTRQVDVAELVSRLQSLWENDFIPTSNAVRSAVGEESDVLIPTWSAIVPELPDAVSDIDVRIVNGSARDALDFAEKSQTGLKVIAIGGDKLSRGLTLEGLCCSYFLRASKMYDTLMQMGRWFGYRTGYLDLCRLYTSRELIDWFGHIADAAEELREEFDLMDARGATPKEYGLKVQSHSILMVTSQVKMRAAQTIQLSFSGQTVETVSLFRDPVVLQRNLSALRQLLQAEGVSAKSSLSDTEKNDRELKSVFLLKDVPSKRILDFLREYQTHMAAVRVNSSVLADFIRTMNKENELTTWDVAVKGTKGGKEFEIIPGIAVGMNQRTANRSATDRYSIGRLLDPQDEAIGLSEQERQAALKLTIDAWKADPGRTRRKEEPTSPSGVSVRHVKGLGRDGVGGHPEKGLLIIYLLDPQKAVEEGQELFSDNSTPVVAFGMSFPASTLSRKVDYKVNNVFWEQEYGPDV